jgi:hypothetical protein
VVIEAKVVALLVVLRGAAALPVIVAYVVPNGSVVLFQPLLVGSRSPSVPVLEANLDNMADVAIEHVIRHSSSLT